MAGRELFRLDGRSLKSNGHVAVVGTNSCSTTSNTVNTHRKSCFIGVRIIFTMGGRSNSAARAGRMGVQINLASFGRHEIDYLRATWTQRQQNHPRFRGLHRQQQ